MSKLRSSAALVAVILVSFCLAACGVLQAEKTRELDAQYEAATNACGPMQAGPKRWAQCQTDAENRYIKDGEAGGLGPFPYRDLITLKQARRADVATRLERGQITVEQANVELATANSQNVSEATRRQTAAQSVSAQQAAAAAAYMSAVRPATPPARQPVTCTRSSTGSSVTCY